MTNSKAKQDSLWKDKYLIEVENELDGLVSTWHEETLLTCLDEMEPRLGTSFMDLGFSNQIGLVLARLLHLSSYLFDLRLQIDLTYLA